MPLLLILSAIVTDVITVLSAIVTAILSAILSAITVIPQTIAWPIMFKPSLIFLFCSLEHMFLLTVQTKWYQWLKWFTKRHLTVDHSLANRQLLLFYCLNIHCKNWQFVLQMAWLSHSHSIVSWDWQSFSVLTHATGGCPLEWLEESAVTKSEIEIESAYIAPCSALAGLHRQYFVIHSSEMNFEWIVIGLKYITQYCYLNYSLNIRK